MKSLLLLRHAKSSWKDPDLDDHDRPLNDRGRLEAPRIGRLLQGEKLLPDLVLSSTAERARATAQAVVEASSYEGTVRFHLELYLAPPSTYVDVLRSLDGDRERVLMIGHNPGIEDLVEILTGEEKRMSTAALAWIELPVARWADLRARTRGTLRRLWRAKDLE